MISIEEYKLLKRIEIMHRAGYEQRVTECFNEVVKCVSDFNNDSTNKELNIKLDIISEEKFTINYDGDCREYSIICLFNCDDVMEMVKNNLDCYLKNIDILKRKRLTTELKDFIDFEIIVKQKTKKHKI